MQVATRNDSTAPAQITYHIDHADRICRVGDGWQAFASENDAPELTRAAVENEVIWNFISDPDTRVIYRLIFDAVRTRMRPLTVSYRCDSPTTRRFMELTCSPLPQLAIEIKSRLLREEPRPYIRALDSRGEHSERFVTLCAWCKKCKISDDEWRDIEDAIHRISAFDESEPPQVSHGMCPDCHLAKLKQIRAGLHERKPARPSRR